MNERSRKATPLADWEIELLTGAVPDLRNRINGRINKLNHDIDMLKMRIGNFIADGGSGDSRNVTEAVERIKINRLLVSELSSL